MNKTINVMLTTGETITREYADYSIVDKVLNVFREEKITKKNEYTSGDTIYLPFRLQIPMKHVIGLEEVEI